VAFGADGHWTLHGVGKVQMVKQACNAADLMAKAIDVMQAMADKAGGPYRVQL